MNRLPTSPEDFDRSLRQLQQQAEGALSPATLARLRQARQQAGTQASHVPWRRRGLWLATACSAVLAVTFALRFNTATAPVNAPATLTASVNDAVDDPLMFDESPELYLWLGSDPLAME